MSGQLLIPLQAELARRLPLCMAPMLGTHNSGITIADGYGNRDEHFQEYFKWIKWVVGALPKLSGQYSDAPPLCMPCPVVLLPDQLNLQYFHLLCAVTG